MNRWLQTRLFRCPMCGVAYLHDKAFAHAVYRCGVTGLTTRSPRRDASPGRMARRPESLSLAAVASRLERHVERIIEAVQLGELPAVWTGCEYRTVAVAIPPWRRVSEEDN